MSKHAERTDGSCTLLDSTAPFGGNDFSEEAAREAAVSHRISPEEYSLIRAQLGRVPNLVEIGMISAMWSEHCSYKSTKRYLRTLPTEGPQVVCGPGENAGVVDIGHGRVVVFKIESHNHPSFIEPYQGAATGVGGILRDVFTMGARPIALLNALRFGAVDHPKTVSLATQVVAGIGGYGNCMGIPTVGGECGFDASYNGNILVNAMAVGLGMRERIFYAAAPASGLPVVYVGSKTGRDGIHGARMASAGFDGAAHEQRPTVQVGDPFAQKLLMEACLELMQEEAILSIQDMGAAGLTCASVEMAGKGGRGMRLVLDKVPVRARGLTPYEMMLSESQERMLMVLSPEKIDRAREVFAKWGVDFAVVGSIIEQPVVELMYQGACVACLPTELLLDPPEKHHPFERPVPPLPDNQRNYDRLSDEKLPSYLLAALSSPHLCSRHPIYQQYDSMVMNDTVHGPGGDAALVRIHGLPESAVALTTDCTTRYCKANPREGAKQAVAESYRNIIAVGAMPLAITNCFNGGNPESPSSMGGIVESFEGMAEACLALEYPIVSGNVSLYNETAGASIPPTPVIGGVGITHALSRTCRNHITHAGDALYLVGDMVGHVERSILLEVLLGDSSGAAPLVDLQAEKRHGQMVRSAIEAGFVRACHDLSDGGLLVALAEMLIGYAQDIKQVPGAPFGAHITQPLAYRTLPLWVFCFAEDQARYLCAVSPLQAQGFEQAAKQAGVPICRLGVTTEAPILQVDGVEGGTHQLPTDQLLHASYHGFDGLFGASSNQ